MVTLWGSLAQIAPDLFQIRGNPVLGWLWSSTILWLALPIAVAWLFVHLWSVDRRLDRQQKQFQEETFDTRKNLNSLESRIWEGLNKSLGALRDKLVESHDELRSEVRAWIEQKQRTVDSDLQKRVTLLERGEHRQRPPEPDIEPKETLVDGRTIVNLSGRAFELGPEAYDYYRRLHKKDQRIIRQTMMEGTKQRYDLGNFIDLTERYKMADGKSWTRKEIDDLPYQQQSKLLDENPDLRDFWLGKPPE